MRSGTSAHVRLLTYRKDASVFLNMLSLRPLFDEEGHLVFMFSISIEISDQFAGVKPLLAQLRRLDELVGEPLRPGSPRAPRQRSQGRR